MVSQHAMLLAQNDDESCSWSARSCLGTYCSRSRPGLDCHVSKRAAHAYPATCAWELLMVLQVTKPRKTSACCGLISRAAAGAVPTCCQHGAKCDVPWLEHFTLLQLLPAICWYGAAVAGLAWCSTHQLPLCCALLRTILCCGLSMCCHAGIPQQSSPACTPGLNNKSTSTAVHPMPGDS
jgi:hypothetical protein